MCFRLFLHLLLIRNWQKYILKSFCCFLQMRLFILFSHRWLKRRLILTAQNFGLFWKLKFGVMSARGARIHKRSWKRKKEDEEMFFWQRRRSAELRLLSAASADPAALRVSVILPLFRPEISTGFHCSPPRSPPAATGCSAQHRCTLSCFQNTVSSLGYDERLGE